MNVGQARILVDALQNAIARAELKGANVIDMPVVADALRAADDAARDELDSAITEAEEAQRKVDAEEAQAAKAEAVRRDEEAQRAEKPIPLVIDPKLPVTPKPPAAPAAALAGGAKGGSKI